MSTLTKNITPLNPFGFSKKNFLAPIGNAYSPATNFKASDNPTTTDTTVPDAVAPASGTSPEVMAAQKDFLRQSMLKKSIRKTVGAGETGGFSPSTNPLKPSAPIPAGARGV